MVAYKRQQVIDAISSVLDSKAKRPSPELQTRVKRLLDTDRDLGWSPRAQNPERANYAFYSGEPPGSGVEVKFSEYEAFALLVGLQLMRHGWPQRYVVLVMRRAREKAEQQHTRILRMNPTAIFDPAKIRREAQPGDFAVGNTNPVFLIIASKSGDPPSENTELIDCSVEEGADAAMRWAWQTTNGRHGFSMLELVGFAFQLRARLANVEPRRRGRAG